MNNEKTYCAALQDIIINSRFDSAAYKIAVRALNPAPALVVTIYADGSGFFNSETPGVSGNFSRLSEGIDYMKNIIEPQPIVLS